MPKCKGGSSKSWENLVAACVSCNIKKGHKELSQLGAQFKLRRQPSMPRYEEFTKATFQRKYQKQAWKQYLQEMP